MRIFASLRSVASALFHRSRMDKEMEEELRAHIQDRANDLERSGVTRAEAERRARIEFGGYQKYKEEIREAQGAHFLESLIQDLRYGLRMLRKSPGFTAVAVLTLVLGIGANTAIFSLTYAVILKSLPVPHPDELARYSFSELGLSDLSISSPAYYALRKHETVNQDILAWSGLDLAVGENGSVTDVRGAVITGNGFRVLEVAPYIGRTFGEQDDAPGGGPNGYQALLGFSYWKQHFDGKKTALGQALSINGRSVRVIGVLPPGFDGLIVGERADIILPLSFEINAPTPDDAGNNWLTVIGRLKPGESLQSARSDVQATAEIVREEADPSHRFMGGLQFHVESGRSGRSFLRADYSQPLLILQLLVAVLLLLCCANVALLMLARVTGRCREFAVRGALGASRGRLLRQMLIEVGILAACGLCFGLWLGWAAARSLISMLGSIGQLPALDVTPQSAILAFAAGATLVSVLVAGLWPALRASRIDPALDLKRSEAVSSFSSKRLGTWIVPTQVALSITLLSSAVLLGGTFFHLLSEHAGFRSDGVTIAAVDLSSVKPTPKQAARDVRDIATALKSAPGVEASTILSAVPISDWTASHYFSITKNGAVNTDMQTWVESVSPAYFEVMGTRVLEGRGFTHADESGAPVCILSLSAAAYFFGNEDAVGRFVYAGGEDPQKDGQDLDPRNACRVVGVSEDARFLSLREAPPRVLYNLATGEDWGTQASFALRSSSASLAAEAVRNAIRKQLPGVPDPEIFTFNELIKNHLEKERMLMSLSLSFGCVALLLVALGLYGVLARSVTLRTKEIGLRLALGAQPRDAVMHVIRRGLHLVIVGAIVGVPVSLASARLLKGLLFGINPDNPVAFAMVVVLVFAVVVGASCIPAWRAAKVDPMVALRHE
ncbi:MAG: ADOP family duplicated permease [Candidatus Acidiferrales bacterium]